jgi:DNA modification methylase
VAVFREVRRVLRDDGTLWLNLGDSYAGSWGNAGGQNRGKGTQRPITVGSVVTDQSERNGCFVPPAKYGFSDIGVKPKDLIGIPWRVAFALQADGWYLRQDIIWHKPNPMPESVRDRCTKAHEYIFLLAKSPRYYYDAESICEVSSGLTGGKFGTGGKEVGRLRQDAGRERPEDDGTRNRRSVWTVTTKPYREAHFATFPPDLIRPCIRAGCPPAGKRCDCDEIILSPTGSGEIEDPSMETGRAGMNRPRRENEGSRPITRREQRHEAEEMRASRHKAEMEAECGPAFAHYIRTDKSGARPLPESIRRKFQDRGWITQAPPCPHPIEPAGTVLDPFGGSGTTGEVAASEGRKAILIELNPEYVKLAKNRGGLFYTSNTRITDSGKG